MLREEDNRDKFVEKLIELLRTQGKRTRMGTHTKGINHSAEAQIGIKKRENRK